MRTDQFISTTDNVPSVLPNIQQKKKMIVGNYQLGSKIGKGSYSTVRKGKNLTTHQDVSTFYCVLHYS
jgi:hypothetical protein